MIHSLKRTFTIALCLIAIQLSAVDYFWIGGTGNWSDISHWATTSGGVLTHNQAPTANDDIYFDANSFSGPGQVVTLNTDIIFCRSMTWNTVTNNPSLVGTDNVTINIYGSWELSSDMTFDFAGKTRFLGASNNTVDFKTHHSGHDIIFSGIGVWTLNSSVLVDSVFQLNEGTINTNGENIDCYYFHSKTQNNRTLTLGSSTFTIRGETLHPNSVLPQFIVQPIYLDATNLTMNAGTSLFILTNSIVDIWMEGVGDINFNRVILSSPAGNSRIIPWDPISTGLVPNMNYNELDLFHPTLLNGSPQIGTLILHPNQRYQFESGEAFDLGEIDASGNCSSTIIMESTGGAQPAMFSSTNNITVDFVSLKSITASGTGSFTANNAIDLENNDGWVINSKVSDDFFWIGGTGNWNDSGHWSFSSGGAPSGCIPSAVDDVFFDSNSFSGAGQTVNINQENLYCHNMDWTGATNLPSLIGSIQNNLHITGSLTLITNMEHTFFGNYYFESEEPGNTITAAGQHFNYDVFFSGLAGEWIFLDEIYVHHTIFFESGTLRTNDQIVEAFSFSSLLPFSRFLYLGNSYITIANHNIGSSVWNVDVNNLTLDAGTSTIELFGGFSNLFKNKGVADIVYNNVFFNCSEGRLFSLINAPSPTMVIDSLIFAQDGFTAGDNMVNYWSMEPGQTHQFTLISTQTIEELAANGSCEEGLIYIQGSNPGQVSTFNLANDHDFERLFIEGINQIGTGQLTANNSIDADFNMGWIFTEGLGETLYWVGDSGSWDDQAHWSYSSGGPGGACIPTPLDDVIFDNNSFPNDNSVVNSGASPNTYCHNMTWTAGVNTTTTFYGGYANIHGSLDIQSTVTWGVTSHFFQGLEDHFIHSNGHLLISVYFYGTGKYTLSDPLNTQGIFHIRGIFDTNNQPVETTKFSAIFVEFPKELILGSSHFLVTGSMSQIYHSFTISTSNYIIHPGTSLIEFSNPIASLFATGNMNFNNVLFSNSSGAGHIIANSAFNHIQFNGNGNIFNSNATDSLVFAAGKTYVLEATETLTINEYWKTIGNNCTPISLSSDINGSKANVNMPAQSVIIADFIQMQDINASGGANFLAGTHSTDIANSNIGWLFETAPNFIDIGFLGEDRAICFDEPVILDAYNFSLGETYSWQDNSSDSILIVDQSGIYAVEVIFQNNCIIQDTIEVLSIDDFNVDIVDDPDLCDGESIELSSGVSLNSATYLWQDGSTESTIEVNSSGSYTVQVDIGGCIDADTTIVSLVSYPVLDLGEDISACEGDVFDLQFVEAAETLLWQDGSTLDNFSGNTSGIYWLEAANGDCSVRDSIEVTYVDAASVSLGIDTLLCDQNDFLLELHVPNATYEWQDGSNSNTFSSTGSGEYWVAVTVQGCSVKDTIQLTFQENPTIEFGDEIFGCEGDLIEISTDVIADTYTWSDGDSDAQFSTTVAGQYYLDATFGTCVVRENIEVILHQVPMILPLGNDASICAGETLTLEAMTDIGAIEWQDGSNLSNFEVNTAGEYWFLADNEGCKRADTILVNVIDYPNLDLGEDISACEGDIFDLQFSGTAETLLWQDGSTLDNFSGNTSGIYWLETSNGDCLIRDSVVVTYVNPSSINLGIDTLLCDQPSFLLELHVPNATYEWQDGSNSNTFSSTGSGEYWVAVTVQGCSVLDTIELTFQENPTIEFGDEVFGCEGDLIEINTDVIADNYAWSDGDSDAHFSTTVAGQYYLDATFGTCVVRENIEVILYQIPMITTLGADETICQGESILLEAITDIGSIEWQDGSNSNTHTANENGTYWFSANNEGCISADSIFLSLLPAPSIDLGEDQQACEGESITLTPSTTGIIFWEDGSSASSRTIQTPGEYWIEIEDAEGCTGRDTIQISFASRPSLDLGQDTTVCDKYPYIIRANFNEGQISWPDGSTKNTYAVANSGQVIAYLDNKGCSARDTINVNFQECHFFEAFVPNAFTPNDDGINDVFHPFFDPKIDILDYTMDIFNRWGDHVFTTDDLGTPWEAFDSGKKVDAGIYVYSIVIKYRDDMGENSTIISGDVLVTR